MADISVLIPAYERPESLIMTLSRIAAQTVPDLQVVVSSQGRHRAKNSPVAQALRGIIEARGGSVEWHHSEPPRHRRAAPLTPRAGEGTLRAFLR
jgi:GT2 family glycosyltransferase